MIRFLLSIILISVSGGISYAQVPADSADRQIYDRLLKDFMSEIESMPELKENVVQRSNAVLQLRLALFQKNPNQFRFDNNLSWSTHWPAQTPTAGSSNIQISDKFVEVNVETKIFELPHSIKNLQSYVEGRVGSQVVKEILSEQAKPLVLGGDHESFAQFFKSVEFIYKIPSLYDNWGIEKYLVSGRHFSDKKPRIVFLVPPIPEYLQHYKYMFSSLTKEKIRVLYSELGKARWKRGMQKEAYIISQKYKGKFDFVTLGYFNQWEQIAKEPLEKYEIQLNKVESSYDVGLMSQLVKVVDKINGQSTTILSLGHERTIWGSATSELIEAVLPTHPKGVLFMGSAGSLDSTTSIYDVSVPREFRTTEGIIQISNFVQNSTKEQMQLHFDATHVQTISPVQQTQEYVQGQLKDGAGTLDVEVSLLAERIQRFNSRTNADIKFGAINLITDKPSSQGDHDLDRIDINKKAKARMDILNLAIESMQRSSSKRARCASVHYLFRRR